MTVPTTKTGHLIDDLDLLVPTKYILQYKPRIVRSGRVAKQAKARILQLEKLADEYWQGYEARGSLLDDADAHIEALRAALRFYENPENWKPGEHISSMGAHRASKAERDNGDTARRALNEVAK